MALLVGLGEGGGGGVVILIRNNLHALPLKEDNGNHHEVRTGGDNSAVQDLI